MTNVMTNVVVSEVDHEFQKRGQAALDKAASAVKSLTRTRETVQPLTKVPTRTPLRDLVSLDDSGDTGHSCRVGDILLTGITDQIGLTGKSSDGAALSLLCGCGQYHSISLQTLRRKLLIPPHFFYPPLPGQATLDKGSLTVDPVEYQIPDIAEFFSVESTHEMYPVICHHITDDLKAEFPQAYDTWRKLRNHVASVINRGGDMRAPWAWFRKDFGFYLFLSEVGPPPAKGMTLHRRGTAGRYEGAQYRWVPGRGAPRRRAGAEDYDPVKENLRARFTATKHRAANCFRPFRFTSFLQFLQAVQPLPEGFDGDPSKWRLQFRKAKELGYGPENMSWQRNASSDIREIPVQQAKALTRGTPAILQELSNMLGMESDADVLPRLLFLAERLNELSQPENIAVPSPDSVQGVGGMVFPDVIETILREARDLVIEEE